MKRRTVGLDIGSRTLRGAEIREDRQAAQLVRYAERSLAPGLMDHGAVSDPGALCRELRAFWKEAGFGTRRVALAIGGPQVVVRTADVPESELSSDDALIGTLTDLVPIPLAEAVVDTLQVDTYLDSDKRSMVRVLIVAAPRDLVEQMVQAALDARLTPIRVDLAPIAAARAVAGRHASVGTKAAEVVIDFGASSTSVVITADGLPRMVRILPVGAASALLEVEQELGCSFDEAQERARTVGIAAESPSRPLPGASGALERCLGPAVLEIVASVNYYRNTADAAALTRAMVVGGGALFGGLAHRLEHDLEIPVEFGNAYANVSSELTDPHTGIFGAVAVGAGIDR